MTNIKIGDQYFLQGRPDFTVVDIIGQIVFVSSPFRSPISGDCITPLIAYKLSDFEQILKSYGVDGYTQFKSTGDK